MPASSRSPRRARRAAPRRSAPPTPLSDPHAPQRLQKVLASGGVGSRRECEQVILEGRVEVDRRVVRELGTRVDPETQEVRVDGVVLRQPKRSYFAVNKPTGVLSTNRDPAGRERVIDLLPTDQRVFSVGRLDRSSEGLMLVTNDGDLAFRLTHPRYGVPKTYWVQVVGSPEPEQLKQLRRGVHLAEGVARVASLKVRRRRKALTEIEIVLDEGRNREIRRLLARIGHKVVRLKRVAIGPLRLGDLPTGGHRRLSAEEVAQLRDAVRQGAPAGASRTTSRDAANKPGREKPGREKPGREKPGREKPGRAKTERDQTNHDKTNHDKTDREKTPRGKRKPVQGRGGGRQAEPAPAYRPPPDIQPKPAGVLGYEGDYQPSSAAGEDTGSAGQKRPPRSGKAGGKAAGPTGRTGRGGAGARRQGKPPAAGKRGSANAGTPKAGKFGGSKSQSGKPKSSKPKSSKPKSSKPHSGKTQSGKTQSGKPKGGKPKGAKTGKPPAGKKDARRGSKKGRR